MRLTQNIIIIFTVLFNGIISIQSLTPHKIVFVNPYILNENDTNERYITNEINGLLDEMNTNGEILFVKERVWRNFAYLLNDPSDLENMSFFHVKTDASGVVLIKTETLLTQYRLELSFYSYYDSSVTIRTYSLDRFDLIDKLAETLPLIKNDILTIFPKIEDSEFVELKNYARHVYYGFEGFNFNISSGIGFSMKSTSNTSNFSASPAFSLNIGIKFINLDIELINYFAPGILKTPYGGEWFTPTVISSLIFGGWFFYDTIRFSLGAGVHYNRMFVRLYIGEQMTDHGGQVSIYDEKINDYLFFGGYLGLSYRPFKMLRIDGYLGLFLDSVEFLGLTNMNSAIYISYFLTENLFINLGIATSTVSETSSSSYNRFNLNTTIATISIGWHFGRREL